MEKPEKWLITGRSYRVERSVENTKFAVLKPGIPFQVPIRGFAKHVIYHHPLERGKKYLMKVTYRDGYGTPAVR